MSIVNARHSEPSGLEHSEHREVNDLGMDKGRRAMIVSSRVIDVSNAVKSGIFLQGSRRYHCQEMSSQPPFRAHEARFATTFVTNAGYKQASPRAPFVLSVRKTPKSPSDLQFRFGSTTSRAS